MSFPARVQCAAGCGAVGDPDLEFLCVACHGDRVELRQHQELKEYMKQRALADAEPGSIPAAEAADGASGSPSRRVPPCIDHRKALEDFLSRPREQNPELIEREREFLQREMTVRNTSVVQLRKYMVASDLDEEVDPKEWGRYQYGAPRPVPRRIVDRATEVAAQMQLFCSWRQRTVRRRLEAERLRREAERKEQAAKTKKLRLRPLTRPSSPSKLAPPSGDAAAGAHGHSASAWERRPFASIWRKKAPSDS